MFKEIDLKEEIIQNSSNEENNENFDKSSENKENLINTQNNKKSADELYQLKTNIKSQNTKNVSISQEIINSSFFSHFL